MTRSNKPKFEDLWKQLFWEHYHVMDKEVLPKIKDLLQKENDFEEVGNELEQLVQLNTLAKFNSSIKFAKLFLKKTKESIVFIIQSSLYDKKKQFELKKKLDLLSDAQEYIGKYFMIYE